MSARSHVESNNVFLYSIRHEKQYFLMKKKTYSPMCITVSYMKDKAVMTNNF